MFRALLVAALVSASAAWSISGYIINRSPYNALLVNYNLTAGRWLEYPTASIFPGYMGRFESDGGTLGTTDGNFVYSIAQGGPQLYFKYHCGATNSYQVVAIPPNYGSYVTGSDSRGSVVNLTITQQGDQIVIIPSHGA